MNALRARALYTLRMRKITEKMATSYVKESELLSFSIYDTRLGCKEGTVRKQLIPLILVYFGLRLQEEQKILYYHPENESVNKKVRNIGLCEALVNFTNTFNPDRPCQAVHTDRKRQVFLEPEPDTWVVMVGSSPMMGCVLVLFYGGRQ